MTSTDAVVELECREQKWKYETYFKLIEKDKKISLKDRLLPSFKPDS